MKILLVLGVAILSLIPAIVLILGASNYRSRVRNTYGILILIGSLLVTLDLLSNAGSYYFSLYQNVEQLAKYAMFKAWIGGISQFLGLLLIGFGLWGHQKPA